MPSAQDHFQALDDLPPLARWLPPIAGLVVACLTSMLVCGAPHRYWASLDALVLSAFSCVLTTFALCALAVWITGALLGKSTASQSRGLVWQVACAAAWFAPVWIFLQRQSLLSVAAAVVLSGALTIVFWAYRSSSGTTEPPAITPPMSEAIIFGITGNQPLLRQLFPALCISFLAECAILSTVTDQEWLATFLAGAFTAAFLWRLSSRVLQYGRNRTCGRPNRFLLVAAAVVFTVLGLGPYLRFGRGHGNGNSAAHGSPSGEWRMLQEASEYPASGPEMTGEITDQDVYPGIVLWPKTQSHVKLTAPTPIAVNAALAVSRRSGALNIPFDGVYWFSRWPERHPSKRAHVANGSPEEFNIRSIGDRPLNSEAHQNLGSLINLNCCSRIQVALEDADRYPGTVSLELILRNTTLPEKPSISLGIAKVTSGPAANDKPINETLTFAIPTNPEIRQFDEIVVAFHLRMDRSLVAARMGIQRFVLIPRGL